MDKLEMELLGDNHISTSTETPLRKDAFKKQMQKIKAIEYYFAQVLEELSLDLTDDSLSGTPYRVAKMYVKSCLWLRLQKQTQDLPYLNKYGYGRCSSKRTFHLIHYASTFSTCKQLRTCRIHS